MASVFNFLKKHRGKIMLTGVIAGGIFVGAKCYDYFVTKGDMKDEFQFATSIADGEELMDENQDLNYGDFLQNDALLTNNEFDVSPSETLAQVIPKNGKYDERTMKIFIFKSYQKTCESTIIQLVPSLKEGIRRRCDIESLLESLQNGVETNKIAAWEKIKVMSFTRLFSAIYSYSLLIISIRVQISIVASNYAKNASIRNKNGHYNAVEKFLGDNLPSFLGNYFGSAQIKAADNTSKDVPSSGASAATHQIFLQALQYFITKGSFALMGKISDIVAQVVQVLPLKESFTLSDFQQLLFEIQAKFSRLNFSNFVVPLAVDGYDDDAPLFRDQSLGRMLNLLKICLENNKFKEILRDFIEEYIGSIVGFLRVNRCEWKDNVEERVLTNEHELTRKNEAALPLAKILPVLTDCFTFVSKLDNKSTFDRLLKAPSVQRYCMQIFDDYKI